MSWNLDSDRPIFVQIIEHMEYDIVSGVLSPGSKVPSVRELASAASVNPNTMQRALSEMERQGLMHTERTSGRYVTDDTNMIESLRKRIASVGVDSFIIQMKRLGLGRDEVLKLVEDNY
ncbi:MAG: GntR family transcriptional regulator [Lachnospiraceae bacterium]|nr:GntR family transcriptional regulator [Lachnospiraceae bacterium]